MIVAIAALCLIELIVLASLVNTEHGFWGLFSLVVAYATYGVFIDKAAPFTHLNWVVTHPFQLLLFAVGYIVLGVVWSFFKYYSYLREAKRNKIGKTYLGASDNTGRIITWTGYWPVSIVAHVLGDGVYKLFRWVYDQVSGVYDNILAKVYGE